MDVASAPTHDAARVRGGYFADVGIRSAPRWEKILQGEKMAFCDDILLRGESVHYICVLAQFLLFEIFGVENNLN